MRNYVAKNSRKFNKAKTYKDKKKESKKNPKNENSSVGLRDDK